MELFGSIFLMDIDNIVSNICHLNMLREMATQYGGQILWFSWHGGYVKKTKSKESNLMAMFGLKWTKDYKQQIILFQYYYLKIFFPIFL